MTNAGRNIESLTAVAKRLHVSPLPGSDRACIVQMRDGTERLAMTRVVNTKQHGTENHGASFYRVSFKFVGDGEADFSLEQDVVWCIVDHKDANIVFGPTEGIQVSEKGIGIGSYLLAQVIRLMQQPELHGNYQVQPVQLPVQAQSTVDSSDTKANNERIEAFLTRAGFYVSPAGGTVTIGARRHKDLRTWWNQDRVKFLHFPQFVELASQWRIEKSQAEARLAAEFQANAGHLQQIARLQARMQAADRELAGLVSQHIESVEQLEQQISDLVQQAQRIDEPVVGRAPAAPDASATREDNGPQSVTIDLSPSVKRFLWVALGVVVTGLLLSANPMFMP